MFLPSKDFSIFSQEFRGETGLKIEQSEDIKLKTINFRDRFFNLFLLRYFELMPHIIKYKYTDGRLDGIDFLKVEVALRNGFNVIIGKNNRGVLSFLGYTKSIQGVTDPKEMFYSGRIMNEKDINWIIPHSLRPLGHLREITRTDNAQTGDFIVLRNKVFNFQNDNLIVLHYAESLSEIVASRYSLVIQSKAMTFLKSQVNDETINEVATDMYNGSPYIKVSDLFDVEDSILTMNNASLSANMTELKREYQNQLNELNSMLGIDALGVDKTSGVSDLEAKSGNPFSKNVSNMYIDPRQTAMNLLAKRENFEVKVVYDNNVASELSQTDFTSEGGSKDDQKDNDNQ